MSNYRMSKERRAAAENAQIERLAEEARKGSTAEVYAYSLKKAETDLRDAGLDGGIRSEDDWRARAAGQDDMYLFIRGKRYRAEVKGGGTVGKPNEDLSWDADNILPRAQYVVIPVITRIHNKRELYALSAIVTREQFLDLLEQASRAGLTSTIHLTSEGKKERKRPRVLAFQPTPLDHLRELVYNLILDEIVPTMQDYIDGALD